MSILVVGAGAAGGYIGAQLIAAGRDVTFLVRPRTLQRLRSEGLRIRHGTDIQTTSVEAVTVDGLQRTYDLTIVAVRANAVESAIDDVCNTAGPGTRIVPIMNGLRHLSLLTAAFGRDRVLGAATRLITSMSTDGVIDVLTPGIEMQIGHLDGGRSDALQRVAAELDVANVVVKVRGDVVAAMWEKFAFIASTAVLTCLVGDEIGPIASVAGGIDLARRVLDEVASVAAADGYPLSATAQSGLTAILTDPASTFGPSMFRDMKADRPIEAAVLDDLAQHARKHGIDTPLLDASMVVVDVHNRRVTGSPEYTAARD